MNTYKRKCPVMGCNSVTTDGLKFFRFPDSAKESTKMWCLFTKVKNFKPIPTEVMCSLHFAEEDITQNKNGKKYLRKNTVPKIYYKNGQKITVQYNPTTHQYIGYGAQLMLQEMDEKTHDEEKELTDLRYQKVKDIRNLCRFCFSNDKNTKCIAMNKLEAYSIDIAEIFSILGINQEYEEAFSKIICADCYDKIIEFSSYREKCQNAQNKIILSMKELDKKILEVKQQQILKKQNSDFVEWKNIKVENDDVDYDDHDFEDTFFDDIIEDQTEEYHPQNFVKIENEEIVKEEYIETGADDVPEVSFKNEAPEILSEDEVPLKKRSIEVNKKPGKPFKKAPVPKKTRDWSNTPKKYECFFCRKKFDKKIIYTSHICEVKRVKCQVENCQSYFTNQGGYNVHLQRRHKLPKVSKHLCPVCKTQFQMSAVEFDQHCNKCKDENKYKEKEIKCEKCKKTFSSIQTFTAHRIFHDAEDLTKINEPSENSAKSLGVKKSTQDVCDLCGKVFINSIGALRRHQINVHFIKFTGNLFYCDLCPIAKPTKALIYSHMKSTHIIRWHSCETCGKVFKNREGWRKHQLIHGDYKKNNLCEVCPHQPGFVTASALKKHMARHHGGAQPVRKFACDICGAAYSRDDQLTRHRVNVHQIFHNNYNEKIIKHYINN